MLCRSAWAVLPRRSLLLRAFSVGGSEAQPPAGFPAFQPASAAGAEAGGGGYAPPSPPQEQPHVELPPVQPPPLVPFLAEAVNHVQLTGNVISQPILRAIGAGQTVASLLLGLRQRLARHGGLPQSVAVEVRAVLCCAVLCCACGLHAGSPLFLLLLGQARQTGQHWAGTGTAVAPAAALPSCSPLVTGAPATQLGLPAGVGLHLAAAGAARAQGNADTSGGPAAGGCLE